jgi:hypothetical protein
MADALRLMAEASLARARARMAAGQDPSAAFAAAQEALRRLWALREQDPRSSSALAELRRGRAEWARARGADPSADVRAGLAAAERALAADPTLRQALEARAALRAAAAGRERN